MGDLLGVDARDKKPFSTLGTSSSPWEIDCPSRIKAPFAEGPVAGAASAGWALPVAAALRPVGEGFVILAVAPEAEIDPKGFRRGVDAALQRLADLTEEGS